MSIKQLDSLPYTVAEKRKNYRQMIRDDLQKAIDNHINCFEFEGDYNYKYLASYVKEEAVHIYKNITAEYCRELKHKYNIKSLTDFYGRNVYKYIKVHTHKELDRIHVYCEIFPSELEKYKLYLEEKAQEEVIIEYAKMILFDNNYLTTRDYKMLDRIVSLCKQRRVNITPLDENGVKKVINIVNKEFDLTEVEDD